MASRFQTVFEDHSDEHSSVEEVSYDKDMGNRHTQPSANDVLQSSLSRLGGPELPSIEASQHSVLFYLSLIEGRCRTQAANSLNKGRAPFDHLPETHPEVHELARHLFREICKELHKAGILPDEYAGPNLENLRSQYLTSFDAILHNIASRQTDNLNLHRSVDAADGLSIDTETLSFAFPGALARQQLQMANVRPPRSSFSLIPYSNKINHSTSSYFKSNYIHLGLLGKGGFGAVHKARHRLANNDDAVKMIVLPAGSTEAEVKKLLYELETLAHLTHQNIVTYRHSWIESVPVGIELVGYGSSGEATSDGASIHSAGDESPSRLSNALRGVSLNASDIFQPGNMDDDNLFERNGTIASIANDDSKEYTQSNVGSKAIITAGKSPKPLLSRTSSPDTEELERSESIKFATRTGLKNDMVLFITMGFYKMTLEDYIRGVNKEGISIQYCFHSSICVRLLLGILLGVQHIHANGFVHRDLKPSNIFLEVVQGHPGSANDGNIDITGCRQCAHDTSGKHSIITPKIGDFGLAAEMKSGLTPKIGSGEEQSQSAEPMALAILTQQQTSTHQQAGTMFYCPPTNERSICPKRDVYSLGIIAFELATKFGTLSERSVVLGALRNGKFPNGFDNELATGIKGMLCAEKEDRWTCEQVEDWLREMIRNEQVTQ